MVTELPTQWPGRTRRSAARLAAAALLALATACTGSQQSDDRTARPTGGSVDGEAAPPAVESRDPSTCDTVAEGRQYCRTVTVSGRAVRYAYVPAPRPSGEVVLVDRGGPGSTLFGPTWPRDLVDRLLRSDPSAGLLLIEEPWVENRPAVACSEAMSSWQRALRSEGPMGAAAAALVDRCHLDSEPGPWGWTPSTYSEVVSSIEQDIGRRATRFVGASFAGTRISYLDRRWDSVALVSPVGAGVRATRLMELRQNHLDRALQRCRACSRGASVSVDGRSVPVTDLDRQAALVALGYYAPVEAARHRPAVQRGTSPEQLLLTGRLSDSATGRIGTDDMSPAVLAIMSEQCRAFGDLRSAPFDGDGYFSRYFSPCGAFAVDAAVTARAIEARALCVSTATRDSVVPSELSAGVLATPAARVTTTTYRGAHGSIAGLQACLGSTG